MERADNPPADVDQTIYYRYSKVRWLAGRRWDE